MTEKLVLAFLAAVLLSQQLPALTEGFIELINALLDISREQDRRHEIIQTIFGR